MLLSVSSAARRAGVDPRAVRAWIADGRLPATRVGNRWVIDELDLEAYERRRSGRPGRRADAATAWGLLALLSDEDAPWLHPSTRTRIGHRLGSAERVVELLRHAAPRADVRRWSALDVDLDRLRASEPLVPTGLAVASATSLHPTRRDLDAYVTTRDLARIERRLKPRPPRDERAANLVLRVPVHPWILEHARAPDAVVAADLLDHPSTRVQIAARQTLERIVRDRHP